MKVVVAVTIKEVSERFGLSSDTLRYYEKIGLLDPVERNSSGIRNYQEKDLARIQFLKCMRISGLSIEMLKKCIHLFHEGDQTIAQRKMILEQQRHELQSKMQELQDSLDHLDHKIETYETNLVRLEKEMALKN